VTRAFEEASYLCHACGEEIVVPVDLSEGEDQDLIEDCPVCCRPQHLRVTVAPDGSVRVESRED
jgi:DNA-directed RNA polymerase subunit RPC12/RpoP